MIKLINEIFWMMGLAICVMLLLGLIYMLLDEIGEKIKDFKDRKTLIKKGTVFYLDGKRVILKRDLELRFKKVKYTECVCEEYKEIPRGIQCGVGANHYRRWAKTNFETNLLNMLRFKKVKYTECVCEEYKEIPRGIQCGVGANHYRRWAKTNFETNLLNMYKEFPDKFNHIIEYINEDNIEN